MEGPVMEGEWWVIKPLLWTINRHLGKVSRTWQATFAWVWTVQGSLNLHGVLHPCWHQQSTGSTRSWRTSSQLASAFIHSPCSPLCFSTFCKPHPAFHIRLWPTPRAGRECRSLWNPYRSCLLCSCDIWPSQKWQYFFNLPYQIWHF